MIAQESGTTSPKADTLKDAFQIISQKEKEGGAVVNFHQDKRIEKILINSNPTTGSVAKGYRVQVFSSNSQATARQEAFSHESILNEAFPDMKVYVTYNSPFWKVRLGDFITQSEARRFTVELLSRFPELKGETYTVRDNISVSSK